MRCRIIKKMIKTKRKKKFRRYPRGDLKEDIPQYPYSVKAPGDWTVAEWISKRFSQTYPGYDAKVFDANGVPVAMKNVKLTTIRKK